MRQKKIRQFIIHAGMHKTGSTSIQKALGNLRNEAFHYLRWNGNRNHSIPYLYAFADGGVHARGDIEKEKAKQHGSMLREVLAKELDLLASENVILSGEAIGAPRLGNGLRNLKDFLDPWTDDFRVFMYVRPPRSYAAAEFSQSICGGGTPVLPIKISYGGVSQLDDVFGSQAVSLLPYIRSELFMNDVVMDFCSRTGIPTDELQPSSANASPSLELLSVLWEVNHHCRSISSNRGPAINEARYRVIRKLSKFGRHKFLMDPAGVQNYEQIREKMVSLSSRVGMDLGASESGANQVSLCSNEQLKEISLQSSPLLVDHVKNMAETTGAKGVQAAAAESGRDMLAARRIVMKMIELEIEGKNGQLASHSSAR